MQAIKWQLLVTTLLLIISGALFYAQIVIFENPRDTFFYLMQDLAFVPVQVILVTLMLNQLLTIREKRALLTKLNMVIGVFFSEVGTRLISHCNTFQMSHEFFSELQVTVDWNDRRFSDSMKTFRNHDYDINIGIGDLGALREFLIEKRPFMLRLLENPNLLEHDTFTDLLLAVFHLTEELTSRQNLSTLPEADLGHLAFDIRRAYAVLVWEWLAYMNHLRRDYPYLFSLAVRQNPFDPEASPIIK